MHEFTHVLDHTTNDFQTVRSSSAYEQAERLADYFAAWLLMPKRVVKRLWFQTPSSSFPIQQLPR